MNSRSLRERKLYGVVDYELMSTIINSSPNIEKVEEKPFQEKIKRYKAERNLIPFLKKISKTFIDNEEGFGDFIKQQILVRRGYNDQWKLLYVNSYNFPSSQLGSIVNSLLYKGAKNSGEFITSVLKKIK